MLTHLMVQILKDATNKVFSHFCASISVFKYLFLLLFLMPFLCFFFSIYYWLTEKFYSWGVDADVKLPLQIEGCGMWKLVLAKK